MSRRRRRRGGTRPQVPASGPGVPVKEAPSPGGGLPSTEPNYRMKCTVCGALPTVGKMGLCGPCVFGEAETADGNW